MSLLLLGRAANRAGGKSLGEDVQLHCPAHVYPVKMRQRLVAMKMSVEAVES